MDIVDDDFGLISKDEVCELISVNLKGLSHIKRVGLFAKSYRDYMKKINSDMIRDDYLDEIFNYMVKKRMTREECYQISNLHPRTSQELSTIIKVDKYFKNSGEIEEFLRMLTYNV